MNQMIALRQILTSGLSYAVGSIGEFIVRDLLLLSGYQVQMMPDGSKTGDIVATNDNDSYRLEVKTARMSKSGRFDFQLFKNDSHGSTNHTNADVLLLVCATTGTIFYYAIPVKVVRKIQHLTIPKHPADYNGKYAKYRITDFPLNLDMVH